ncbi:histidine kinase N-terminal 7TM domain-containing protein [Salinigranum sp. GCM10025319]|uniref:histidine kinase N-terminal 7TM domain-containing protein n=1 Tax=Salinigranum sp. GCM10025319 TaxID=3252687 RepID=UPI00360C6DDA
MRPPHGVVEGSRSAIPFQSVVSQVSVEPTPPVVVVVIAAVLAVGVAAAVWRRRDRPGSASLAVLALGAGWWSLCYALELSSPALSGTLYFGRLAYVGIVVVPLAWFTFALAYTGRGTALGRWWLVALATPCAAMVALAWTTLSTGLVWTGYELVPAAGLPHGVLSVAYGPAFWLWTAYAYALTGSGTLLLLASVAKARVFRRQTAVLLVGVTAPWIGNLAFVADLSPLDLTPIGFVVSAVVLGGGLYRYRLLDVHPVTGGIARAELVERLPDAVVAIDDRGRIVDLNPSAESVLGVATDDAVGSSLERVAPSLAGLLADADDTDDGVADYVVSDPPRYYEVRVSPLRNDRAIGRLVTLRDVTGRRRREREIAVLNRVLRHDLRNDVAVIENYAALLERDPGNESYVSGIADRAAEMRNLVETVRRVERHLDTDEPTLSTLDIAQVVRERAEALARTYSDATVETDLPSAAWVRALDLVDSAVDNLVENAVEHNDSASPRVWVSVERVAVDGERYVDVTVADDGPPIPEGDRDVLVGQESSLDEASGLGLWLVHWIVTESGGRVTYEPNEPRGNVVTVRLRTPEGEQYETASAEETAATEPTGSPQRDVTGDGTSPGTGSPGAASTG